MKIVHSIATTKDLDMTQFDIKTTFLHGEFIKEFFMDQPHNF
jgi:hypothetical protein